MEMVRYVFSGYLFGCQVRILNGCSPGYQAGAKKIFEKLDTASRGFLEASQLVRFLKAILPTLKAQEAQCIVSHLYGQDPAAECRFAFSDILKGLLVSLFSLCRFCPVRQQGSDCCVHINLERLVGISFLRNTCVRDSLIGLMYVFFVRKNT